MTKQKIFALEYANKDLAGRIKVYDLEKIRRKESQKDGESQTEPDTEPTNMESRGTETSFIGWDPNVDGEMELDAEGELEPTEIEDGEQVEQDDRQEDQQQGLQDAPRLDQHEMPQDISEVREEQRDGQQEDPKQEVIEGKLEAEPYIQLTGEQEEPQKQLCDCRDEAQQYGTTSDSQANRKESEEDISHKEMLSRGERQLERLMGTTQDTVVGGHTEVDNMEQQEAIETSVGNDQPMFEAPAEHSPPETQEVPLVGITREPATAEPVDEPEPAPVSSTECPQDRDHHGHGRHRHRRGEAGDRRRHRDHHRDRDDERHHRRHSHHNDRTKNRHRRSRRSRQDTTVIGWIRLHDIVQTYFGVKLPFPRLSLSIRS